MALVLGMDAAVQALLRKPKAHARCRRRPARCEEIWKSWKGGPERQLLGIETALLLDAAGDPSFQGYFAARFRGKEQGDFLYFVEPAGQEQVTLGRFVPVRGVREGEAQDPQGDLAPAAARPADRPGAGRPGAVGHLGLGLAARARTAQPFPGNASFEPREVHAGAERRGGPRRLRPGADRAAAGRPGSPRGGAAPLRRPGRRRR